MFFSHQILEFYSTAYYCIYRFSHQLSRYVIARKLVIAPCHPNGLTPIFCTPPWPETQKRGVTPQLSDFKPKSSCWYTMVYSCFVSNSHIPFVSPCLTHPRLPDTSMAINTAALKGNISVRVRICSCERRMES